MKKFRWLCFLMLVTLWVCTLPTAAAPQTTEIERLDLVTAENLVPDSVYFYNGTTQYTNKGYQNSTGVFSRVDGRSVGSALLLNGNRQYLRLRTPLLLELESYTFSTHIKWNGSVADKKADDQKLVTLYVNQYTYITVCLHGRDTAIGLDGPYIEWATPEAGTQTVFTKTDGSTSFAFPENEWHHVAVTFSENAVILYIDGVKQLQADIDVRFDDMQGRRLVFGAGYAGAAYGTEKTLHAALEDAALYTAALSDAQVSLLARDLDPLSGSTATTPTDVLATRPTTSATAPAHKDTFSGRLFGLPLGLVITLGMLLTLTAMLSVIFSIRDSRADKEASR